MTQREVLERYRSQKKPFVWSFLFKWWAAGFGVKGGTLWAAMCFDTWHDALMATVNGLARYKISQNLP